MTAYHDQADVVAKKIIANVGNTVVIAVPLGIGKPVSILNALYRLAENDPTINLTILTGLTLARPTFRSELEKRLAQPVLDRLLGDYEDPLYEKAREQQTLPTNVNVIEFFLSPGKFLKNTYVQQNYISSNYSAVIQDLAYYKVNVVGLQVAQASEDAQFYSLSSNPDLFAATQKLLTEENFLGEKIAIVAEVNRNLPFMAGDALVPAEQFTDVLDSGCYRTLFPLLREALSVSDQMIGLYTSALIKDDSCLQIGIGRMSNAVASALIFRQQDNSLYRDTMRRLGVQEKFAATFAACGSMAPFAAGLYASTEMFSDEYMQLYFHDILKKKVYDHVGLQSLLNSCLISEEVTSKTFDILLQHQLIHAQLTAEDVKFLVEFGIFQAGVTFDTDKLVLPSGAKLDIDLSVEANKLAIIQHCLGQSLKKGKILHGGFYLGSLDFYKQLHDLSPEALASFEMTTIARTNSLYWNPELLRLQRSQARFVNTAMMLTLGGSVVSDGLTNMQEISGVGGQFDFIAMAQQLEQARSIIMCHSTRKTNRGLKSNIVWQYPNMTAPRFFRDIMVTEYGIADCRSKTDAEVIKAILNVTDSRFQAGLLKKAKKAGKVARDYEIPMEFQNNYPHQLKLIVCDLQVKGYCLAYPFGSDLTQDEQVIVRALGKLKGQSRLKLLLMFVRAIFSCRSEKGVEKYLQRMQLSRPTNMKEFVFKKLLVFLLF